jgi:hypothetical protein
MTGPFSMCVVVVSDGTQTIHAGDRHLVDRNDRRDLCIF